MNPFEERVRWVGFLRGLTHPFKAVAGSVIPLPVALLEGLKITEEGRAALVDITPTVLSYLFAEAFQSPLLLPERMSNIVLIRCPACASEKGISACQDCEGTRKQFVLPNFSHSDFLKAQIAFRFFIKEAARITS